jgi:predicted O-methyltransferase YrrM
MRSPSEQVRDAYQYLQENELQALRETIKSLSINSVCINIGAGFGTSGMAFIESDKVGKLYTVDLYSLMAQNGLGSLEFEMGQFVLYGYGNDPRFLQVQGDSIEVGKTWEEKVDMIFLDGDHSYEHCYKDIEAWLPHIKKNGVFAFHDYKEPRWPGVGTAIDELLIKYEMISNAPTFVAFRIGEIK